MTAQRVYRIAAAVLLLTALGHTYGFQHVAPNSPAAAAVRQSMDSVRFELSHGTFSWGGFFMGFGLDLGAYLLFSAFLAWHLGWLAARHPGAIGGLGWAFFGLQVVNLVLGCIYFSGVPAIMAGLAMLATGWAAWLSRG